MYGFNKQNHKQKAPKTQRSLAKLSVSLILIILLGFSLFHDYLKVKRAENRLTDKKMQIDEMIQVNERLKEKLVEIESQDYIEAQIRDNLGMTKEGEIVIVLPGDDTLRRYAPEDRFEEVVEPLPIWKKWLKLFSV